MVKNLFDVYEHNLKEMLYVENFLLTALEKIRNKAYSEDVKNDLEEHRAETQVHVDKLLRVFDLSEITPEEKPSFLWAEMDRELEVFFSEMVTDEASDFYVLEMAMKAERLEISHYETLILITKELNLDNEREILGLLRDNLDDEEHALYKARNSMKKQLSFWRRSVH